MKNFIFKVVIFNISLLITWFIFLFMVKARNSTNPGTIDANLFSSAGDKITASKWNALVNEIPMIYTCTNADSSTPCAEAKLSNWWWTANYRAFSCRRSAGAQFPAWTLYHNGTKWQFQNGVWEDCLDGSVLVMKIN